MNDRNKNDHDRLLAVAEKWRVLYEEREAELVAVRAERDAASQIVADVAELEPRARQCRGCTTPVSATGYMIHDEDCVVDRAERFVAAAAAPTTGGPE